MTEAIEGENNALVILEDVCKVFRSRERTVKALDKVSARMRPGIITGLIGPDGAGKTTLMRLIVGLLRPDEGHLSVMGIDIQKHPEKVQSRVGYMPQQFGLYEDLTVQENLDLYADLKGLPAHRRPERYEELMRMTGLGEFTRRLAGALSGGMKQKLGLACTLLSPPRLLLLDEPTVGVDPVSRRELWSIIYRLVEKEEMTVLISTAYLDEAEQCQEVLLLHEGRMLGMKEPEAFSQEKQGQTYRIPASGAEKRRLLRALVDAEGVVDATVHRSGVRLVMADKEEPQADKLLPDHPEADILPIPPRFEDSFVALLRKEGKAPSATEMKIPIGIGRSTGEDVIMVQDVKRRFGNFYAVKGLSFSVRQGQIFGLLGANGAGKSTTFRMLCGLLPASEGTLRVAGKDLRTAAAQARGRIGYMAQKFSLYTDLTVDENLAFFSSAYGLTGRTQRERIAWAKREFELSAEASTTSGSLPLGFKQRLALAASLMHGPEILFLDEPTSGVDPLARREFWQRISALAEKGVTVMVTTHFMEEAEYCDRLVIMAQGELLAEGTPEELKSRFRTSENPDPNMEETFISLVKSDSQEPAA
ncbi:MAG TPA: ATP-binding cassette domain-containing protein [Desulfuromonadales bacterium]|nr:ATP-binding cassette domain-containing protein [Desulfuromonadales bacterium]